MLASVQSYLRRSASRARDVARIGPFLATFTPGNANRYLNYAIPDDGCDPSQENVQSLVDTYAGRKRIPRLEYFPLLAPTLENRLIEGGFAAEGRLPVMVYSLEKSPVVSVPVGIKITAPQDDAEIYGVIAAQNEAYGDPEPRSGAVARHREFLQAGGISVLASDVATGEVVGGGVCDVPFDGCTELAGIGVRAAFRRKGIATAMTAWLVEKALASGTQTVFLMAAHETEALIYSRTGFAVIGEMLHISLR